MRFPRSMEFSAQYPSDDNEKHLGYLASLLVERGDTAGGERLLKGAFLIAQAKGEQARASVRTLDLVLACFYVQTKSIDLANEYFGRFLAITGALDETRIVEAGRNKYSSILLQNGYKVEVELAKQKGTISSTNGRELKNVVVGTGQSLAKAIPPNLVLNNLDRIPWRDLKCGNAFHGGDGGSLWTAGLPSWMDVNASGSETTTGGYVRAETDLHLNSLCKRDWIFRALNNRGVQYQVIKTDDVMCKVLSSELVSSRSEQKILSSMLRAWQKDFFEALIEKFNPLVRGGIVVNIHLAQTGMKSIEFTHFTNVIPLSSDLEPELDPNHPTAAAVSATIREKSEVSMKRSVKDAAIGVAMAGARQLPTEVESVKMRFIIAGDPLAEKYKWKSWLIGDKSNYSD